MSSSKAYDGYWRAALLDGAGRKVKRDIYSYTEAQYWDLVKELKCGGFDITNLTWKKSTGIKFDVFKNRQRMAVLEAVLRLVEVGKSPGTALDHVITGFEDPFIRTRLEPARDIVRQKGNITDALRVSGLMTPPVLAMLEAGESSGSVQEALRAAVKYLQNQFEVFKKLTWKIGLIAFELITTLMLSWGIYKSGKSLISNAIEKMGLENSAAFLARLDIAIYVNNLLLFVGGGAVTALCALIMLYIGAGYNLRQTMDPLMLRLPFFRALIEDNSFGISFGVIGRILSSGGQLDKALRTAIDSAQVPAVRTYFEQVSADLMRGAAASRAFNSPQLKYHEKVSLTSFSNLKQLGKIFLTISEVREQSLATNINKVVSAATAFTVVCGAVGFWVMYQGYEIINSGIGQQIHQTSF